MRLGTVIRIIFCGYLLISGVQAASNNDVLVPVAEGVEVERLFLDHDLWRRRHDLLRAVDHSIRYLQSEEAGKAYETLEGQGITREVVASSLARFRFHLRTSRCAEELARKLAEEFTLYRSIGTDGNGTVKFTGYFQPTYTASRVRTQDYRYPIYSRPTDLSEWGSEHPSRVALEGYDGQGRKGAILVGRELAFLKTRYEAFMIHVQGSAILELTDGSTMAVGYAANTNYRFVGFVPVCLRNKRSGMSIKDFFLAYPQELDRCLAGNNRYIFFQERPYPDPIGSLGVPVIPHCSIATDKSKMPPGAFGVINVKIPYRADDGSIALRKTSRIVLDQDSGGAIKGPGRVDIFMGTGPEAGRMANFVYSNGELYYIFLKEQISDKVSEGNYSKLAARL